jgi:undecaprenyl diphosphate synthase
VRKRVERAIEATAQYDKHTLTLALNYGGRTEIAQAARQLAEQVQDGSLSVESIDEDALSAHLYQPDLPDPDLLIRTSGEFRLSNFMLWQLSYTEMYVTDICWPEFKEEQFYEAIQSYNQRDRRFGARQ